MDERDKGTDCMSHEDYEAPVITDYGDLQELTANNELPPFVDVPQGTPFPGPGPGPQLS